MNVAVKCSAVQCSAVRATPLRAVRATVNGPCARTRKESAQSQNKDWRDRPKRAGSSDALKDEENNEALK